MRPREIFHAGIRCPWAPFGASLSSLIFFVGPTACVDLGYPRDAGMAGVDGAANDAPREAAYPVVCDAATGDSAADGVCPAINPGDGGLAARPGLVAHFTFNESAGSLILLDRAGGVSDNGMLFHPNAGSDFFHRGPEPGNNAFRFGGMEPPIRPYFEVPASADINSITSGVTIAAWVRKRPGGGWNSLVERRHAGWRSWALLGTFDRRVMFAGGSAPFVRLEGNTVSAIADDRWVHVAATYDHPSRTAKVYLNGILDGANTDYNYGTDFPFDPMGARGPIRIGNGSADSNFSFDGDIDEIEIYNRALGDAEITMLYRPSLADGLVAYFKFDESAGATLAADGAGAIADNATLRDGNAFSGYVPGLLGNAFQFVPLGSKPRFDAPPSVDLDSVRDGVTIATWYFRPAGAAPRGMILYRQSPSGKGFYGLASDWDRALVWAGDYGAQGTGPGVVPDDRWVHLAGTYRRLSRTLVLYLDGVEVYRNGNYVPRDPLASSATSLEIGGGSWGPDWGVQGKLDDLRLYSRVLDAEEISTLARKTGP